MLEAARATLAEHGGGGGGGGVVDWSIGRAGR
jgi:hypothetical protein